MCERSSLNNESETKRTVKKKSTCHSPHVRIFLEFSERPQRKRNRKATTKTQQKDHNKEEKRPQQQKRPQQNSD
jgi:methionine-rich copper-binding protein CopC